MTETGYNESTPDQVYKWTIRFLYGAAITLNLWYLLENYRDTPEGKRVITRVENISRDLLRPWHERKHFRRQADETLVEAWIIVDEASKGK
jgi:hypothetical protein